MLISAFACGDISAQAIKQAFTHAEIWASPELLNEYREVPTELEAEGKISHLQLRALISGIASFVVKANIITPRKIVTICRDPEDNMLLECCLAAKVDFLITGDKDIKDIDKFSLPPELSNLKIVTPREIS